MNKLPIACMIVLVVAGLVLFGGCNARINTVTVRDGKTYTEVGDTYLDGQIRVEEIKRDEGTDIPTYNVRIKNLDRSDMVLEVKMDFYRFDGVKLDNPWGWKPLTLESRQDDWVKFTAPSKEASFIRFYVQKAER